MWLFTGSGGACCSMSVCRSPQVISPSDTPAPAAKSKAASLGASPQSSKHMDTLSTAETRATGGGGSSPSTAGSPQELRKVSTPAVADHHAPAATLAKGRSADKLESAETASIASSTKNSTRSAYSAASSIGSEFINGKLPAHQRDIARIQSQMKTFVKGMVRGREMNVLSVDGQLRTCTCSFDRKLRSYSIVINKETRSIPLSKFKEVLQGTEPDDIATPLDELCATFVLDSGECLSFRFKDVQERESFAICLQIIVDGHQ
uniref:ISP3 C-terminal domain-containing protein n=1 Tax=Alexandrium catenella TaxID=2925 RepID=A0A7S1LVM7_ALECA|mmetsp:Transcript_14812/g.40539  ORF Transcript_14812/g.40539 Transcript_14812/m.40539 type:complete len:262 (+) Transcript_14812:150-935(+)